VIRKLGFVGQRMLERAVGGDLSASVPIRSSVPLARRNIFSDKKRLARSAAGIGFAVLLILVQLGFKSAFLDSALEITRQLDGELFLISPNKFRWGRSDPFPHKRLEQALAVGGIASARPIYAEYRQGIWKGPQDRQSHTVQVLGFDPDQPVFLFPEVRAHLAELRQPDSVLFDRAGRHFLGTTEPGTVTELARRQVVVLGSFAMGPDFTIDGTVITADRTFFDLFPGRRGSGAGLGAVDVGVIKLAAPADLDRVQAALRAALPADVLVLNKDQMLARETYFQNAVSQVGPIFGMGVGIGFVVGMLISYQILFTDLSEQLPLFAMLKAIGYDNRYVLRVVLAQALIYAAIGFLPAFFASLLFYGVIGRIALLPMRMSLAIGSASLGLTLVMCLISGILAVRRVMSTDPAEVF
jgi:putative ABC transport system permease protein